MGAGLTVIRYTVLALVAVTCAVAFAAMAMQRRMLSPFGALARGIRRMSDPFLKPIERRVLRSGGNPQSAPWWLIGISLVVGIMIITGSEWLAGQAMMLAEASRGGGRGLAFFAVNGAISLLMLALMVRVIGSWFGATQYTPWMKPFYALTEWMLAPLRRILPPFGPLDLSPLVAWFVLSLLRPWLLNLF